MLDASEYLKRFEQALPHAEGSIEHVVERDISNGLLRKHKPILWSSTEGRQATEQYIEKHPDWKQLSTVPGLSVNLDTLFTKPNSEVPLEKKIEAAHKYSLAFAEGTTHPLVVRAVKKSGTSSIARVTENTAILNNPHVTHIQEIWLDDAGKLVEGPVLEKWQAHYAMKQEWMDNAIRNLENAAEQHGKESPQFAQAEKELQQQFANCFNVINSRDNDVAAKVGEALPTFGAHGIFTKPEMAILTSDSVQAVMKKYPMTLINIDAQRLKDFKVVGKRDQVVAALREAVRDGKTWDRAAFDTTHAAQHRKIGELDGGLSDESLGIHNGNAFFTKPSVSVPTSQHPEWEEYINGRMEAAIPDVVHPSQTLIQGQPQAQPRTPPSFK